MDIPRLVQHGPRLSRHRLALGAEISSPSDSPTSQRRDVTIKIRLKHHKTNIKKNTIIKTPTV
jgi:hypothetical protein